MRGGWPREEEGGERDASERLRCLPRNRSEDSVAVCVFSGDGCYASRQRWVPLRRGEHIIAFCVFLATGVTRRGDDGSHRVAVYIIALELGYRWLNIV